MRPLVWVAGFRVLSVRPPVPPGVRQPVWAASFRVARMPGSGQLGTSLPVWAARPVWLGMRLRDLVVRRRRAWAARSRELRAPVPGWAVPSPVVPKPASAVPPVRASGRRLVWALRAAPD
ncbi:hypothetical protein EBN03_29090 [Nocardia stercoris]|uniref:Uncharacterized protein n=1 Tax=Nocardia stercoris TaxID=2483361 RepID=A0A3M2KU99_9NOCA|nr:hypothetical protein EBN03_29090 [Nocardia stercoris]